MHDNHSIPLTKSQKEIMQEFYSIAPAKIFFDKTKNNIQSAVFNERVYAQTLANIFGLSKFANSTDATDFIPTKVKNLMASYSRMIQYAYSTDDKSRMLLQVVRVFGSDELENIFIDTTDFAIYTIRFMSIENTIDELNIQEFNNGGCIHSSTAESIKYAIINAPSIKKFDDVICTEDENGYLTMIPVNQIQFWAKIEGKLNFKDLDYLKVKEYYNL